MDLASPAVSQTSVYANGLNYESSHLIFEHVSIIIHKDTEKSFLSSLIK